MALKSVSLSDIGNAIASVQSVVVGVDVLRPYIAPLMETFETVYADSQDAGDAKLLSVLAALKAVAVKIGVEWTEGLEDALKNLIAVIKAAYNAITDLVSGGDSEPVAA